MPPFKIKEFHHEILEAGRLFDSLSSMDFHDAESVSKGVAHVLEVVELITSRVNNTQEYVTTREIREVSIFAFSVLINALRSF